MEPVVEFKNISKTFSRNDRENTEALSDVSFFVMPGDRFGILGESGSGKSTLVTVLVGLIAPSAGEIFVYNIKYGKKAEMPRELIGRMQMVFQDPIQSFDPRRTIGFSIGEGLYNKKVPKSDVYNRVKEELLACGLPENFAERYPHQLSGGQCQRAAIARALITKPDILICDEATSSLDVSVQTQIMDLLKSIQERRNITIIFISHNIPLVQKFCNRGIILKSGRINGTFEAKSSNLIEYL